MKPNILFKSSYYLIMLYFTYLMVLITLQYIPIDFDVAFLRIKQEEIQYKHYQIAFFIHVYTSMIVLVVGLFQFSNYLRTNYLKLHKFLGRIYVVLILLFSSTSGLVMGYYANGGIYSKVSFCLLSILWFYYTFISLTSIKDKKILLHKQYTLRSFALTLSAISLRLFKFLIVYFFSTPPMTTYKIVAWSWIINLLLVEIYIYYLHKDKYSNSNENYNL
ncbi:DUF2306 domain-containing protein [Tenacibaculum sp. 190524A05c]|uniref:DUF2306 domain-containing protein n=1 Tax=Tenacibaculum platacis TaxID=3137852 RepID=UPI0032B2C87A